MGGSYEYLGCYADPSDDRVFGGMVSDSDMTPMVRERSLLSCLFPAKNKIVMHVLLLYCGCSCVEPIQPSKAEGKLFRAGSSSFFLHGFAV